MNEARTHTHTLSGRCRSRDSSQILEPPEEVFIAVFSGAPLDCPSEESTLLPTLLRLVRENFLACRDFGETPHGPVEETWERQTDTRVPALKTLKGKPLKIFEDKDQ